MFRQCQLAVHGLAILLGRNKAGISNRGKFFLHHAVVGECRFTGCPISDRQKLKWSKADAESGGVRKKDIVNPRAAKSE